MRNPGLLQLLLGTSTLGGVALRQPSHPPADGEIILGHDAELPVKRVADFSSWYGRRVKRSRELLAKSLEGRLHPAPQEMLASSGAQAQGDSICAGGPCDNKQLDEMSREELENELRYANAKRIDKKATWQLRKSDVLKARSAKTVAEAHHDAAAVAEAREDIEVTKARAAEAEAEHSVAHDYHQEVARQLAKQGYTEEEVRNSYAEADDAQGEKMEEEYGHDSIGEEIARAEREEEAREAREAKAAAEKKAASGEEKEESPQPAVQEEPEPAAEADTAEEEHAPAEKADQEDAPKAEPIKEMDSAVTAGEEDEAHSADNVEGTVRDPTNQNAWWQAPGKKAKPGIPWWGAPTVNPAKPGTNTGGSPPAVFPVLALLMSLAAMLP